MKQVAPCHPQETQFQTDSTPGYDNCTDLASYLKAHRGFGGPLCYNGSIPTMS